MNTTSKNSIATTQSKTNNMEANTMTNEIMTFNYNETQVRTIEIEGEPWFVLKDVCGILGLGTPARVVERLDEDEVSLTHLTDSLGRQQNTTIINESGLYSVILRSDKPEAKPFRKWVTSEVLPSIRKTGKYNISADRNNASIGSQSKFLDELNIFREKEDKLIKENMELCKLNLKLWDNFQKKESVITAYLVERKKYLDKIMGLEQKIAELDMRCKKAEAQAEHEKEIRLNEEKTIKDLKYSIHDMRPSFVEGTLNYITSIMSDRVYRVRCGQYKIDYYDAVVNTEWLYTIEETAKLCSSDKFVIGRNQLYDWLMNNGYIIAQNKLPYQKYIENGVFRVCLCDREDEETDNGIGVFVTSEGLKYLYAELSKSSNEFKIK